MCADNFFYYRVEILKYIIILQTRCFIDRDLGARVRYASASTQCGDKSLVIIITRQQQ